MIYLKLATHLKYCYTGLIRLICDKLVWCDIEKLGLCWWVECILLFFPYWGLVCSDDGDSSNGPVYVLSYGDGEGSHKSKFKWKNFVSLINNFLYFKTEHM